MPETDNPRIDTVKGMLKEEYTGRLVLANGDCRFKCAKCSTPINTWHGLGPTRMYVDSEKMIWCGSCWHKAKETTIRNLDNNPDDTYPKFIHPGKKHYQRLVHDKSRLEKWNDKGRIREESE